MKQQETTEQRRFTPHDKLLLDVIQRQAGSLSKGLLETVMNAVDAEATFINIRLDAESALISDDGKGFGTKENLIKVFEVFGQPHSEDEHKVFGSFRCGRGQLFCYGQNEWKSGSYRMTVDIKKNGLNYELAERQSRVAGCKIRVRLYETCSEMDQLNVTRDLEKWCKYAPIKVYFNDKLISQDPARSKWDQTTPEAYVKLNTSGSLSLYNLGIHVCEFPNYKFGTGGIVISRQQLKVNLARNDVQSDCPVWKQIKPLVDQLASRRNLNKKVLDDGSRQRLADQIIAGELPDKYETHCLKIITAVTGRHYSLSSFAREDQVTAAEKGNRLGDRLMKQGRAFVVATETLERFAVDSVVALLKLLKKQLPDLVDSWGKWPKVVPFESLTEGLNTKFVLLLDSELTATENKWLGVMNKAANSLRIRDDTKYGKTIFGWQGRKLHIGTSDSANGWTDGKTYVAINRSYLAERNLDFKGLTDVLSLLIHEACHDDDDLLSHDHDQEFYETFHDMVRDCMGNAVNDAITFLPHVVKGVETRLSKKNAKVLDKMNKVAEVV